MRLLLFLLLAATAPAQTWFKVATESATTSVTLPAGTVYRLGAGTTWSASTTVAAVTTFNPLSWPSGQFPFPDPANQVTKELDVLETTAVQNIPLVINGVSSTLVIPALVPTVIATYTCTINLYSDGSYQSTNCMAVTK